jgi:hypothetical protein
MLTVNMAPLPFGVVFMPPPDGGGLVILETLRFAFTSNRKLQFVVSRLPLAVSIFRLLRLKCMKIPQAVTI